jgi:hypothetical protein
MPPWRFLLPALSVLDKGQSDRTRFTPFTVAAILITLITVGIGSVVGLYVFGGKETSPFAAIIIFFVGLMALVVMGFHRIEERVDRGIDKAQAVAAVAVTEAKVVSDNVVAAAQTVVESQQEMKKQVNDIHETINGNLDRKLENVAREIKEAENRIVVDPNGPLPPCIQRMIDETVAAAVDTACERIAHAAAQQASDDTAERMSNVERRPPMGPPQPPTDRPAEPDEVDRGFGGARP